MNAFGHKTCCTLRITSVMLCSTQFAFETSSILTSIWNFVVEVRHDAHTDPHLLVGLSVVRAHLAPPTCKHVSSCLYGGKARNLAEVIQSDLCCIVTSAQMTLCLKINNCISNLVSNQYATSVILSVPPTMLMTTLGHFYHYSLVYLRQIMMFGFLQK